MYFTSTGNPWSKEIRCNLVEPTVNPITGEILGQNVVTVTITLSHVPTSGPHGAILNCKSVPHTLYAYVEAVGSQGGYYVFEWSYTGGTNEHYERLRYALSLAGPYYTGENFGFVGYGSKSGITTNRWWRGESCFGAGTDCHPFDTRYVATTECGGGID